MFQCRVSPSLLQISHKFYHPTAIHNQEDSTFSRNPFCQFSNTSFDHNQIPHFSTQIPHPVPPTSKPGSALVILNWSPMPRRFKLKPFPAPFPCIRESAATIGFEFAAIDNSTPAFVARHSPHLHAVAFARDPAPLQVIVASRSGANDELEGPRDGLLVCECLVSLMS